MGCKQPFVELAKSRRTCEEQDERIRKLFNNSLFKAHQIKVHDVLQRVLKATKEEENLFVGFSNNSTLTLSRNVIINGSVTGNKKLSTNFLKVSIIAKNIVLGQTVSSQYLLQPCKKISLVSLTEEILAKFYNLDILPICYGIFEEQWVSACERHNQKNKYRGGKCKFHVDHHNLNHPKLCAKLYEVQILMEASVKSYYQSHQRTSN